MTVSYKVFIGQGFTNLCVFFLFSVKTAAVADFIEVFYLEKIKLSDD